MATAKSPETTLDTLLKALTGGGGNSSSSNSSPAFNSQAGQSATQILQQIAGLTKEQAIADSTGLLNTISQNAMRSALPSLANAGRGAGLYNSTTQQQLLDNLQAQITAANQEQIQQNILNYSNASTQAANALAGLNNSSRVQTTQSGLSASDAFKQVGTSFLLGQGAQALKRTGLLDWGGSASDAVGAVTDVAAPVVSNFADVFSNQFTDNFASMGAGFPGAPSVGSVFDSSNIFDSITSGIGDVVGGISSTIGDLFDSFGSWTGWWANGGRLPGKKATGGKDNLVVGAGGGEVILPVDTVEALDARLGKDWVDQLIAATHKTVIPDPTEAAKAKAKASAVTK